MRIKTQFALCIVVFSVILVVIVASVTSTEEQVNQLNAQEAISSNIEQGASKLNSISIDYFLYQEGLQISRWQTTVSSLSSDLSNLKPYNAEQQTLANSTTKDLQTLNSLFDELVVYLQNAPRNVSVRIDPAFQTRWSGLALQSQTLNSHASQLSHSLVAQAKQANETNNLLIVSLVSTFGALLATIYLIVFRRTLKSVSELQNGIKTIGSGNLSYVIKAKRNDEISELSRAFNEMTTNLKTVTASKVDLEQEIVGRKQAENSLRESEQRWATTLASIGDAVISTNLSGRILFMNGVAEELTGWTLNDVTLKPVKEVFHIVNEQTREEVEDPVSKVLEKGLIVGLANHTILIRKDKTEVAIDDSGAPIRDKEGKTTGVVLIFRDITERKRFENETQRLHLVVQEERDRLSSLLNSINDEVWFADKEKTFTLANPAAIKKFKLKPTDQSVDVENLATTTEVYRSDGSLRPLEEAPPLRALKGEVLKNQEEIVRTSANGELRYRLVSSAPVRGKEGNIIGSVSVVRDITELKQLQNRLQKYTEDLEKLVEERTKQLKDSERLATIGATAGMVGHDIRNPLQAITGDLYLAKTDLASIPESEEKQSIQESLTAIENNIDYIAKIVQDLQDYARPLNPQPEEADLKLIITQLFAKNNMPDNIELSVKVENSAEKISTDSHFINRIMFNLINNAVQAMPNGGKLTVHAFRGPKDLVMTVKDTGVGIPKDIQGKMFTAMFTTKAKGQGFGLPVVKRMTESLGGSVTFESQGGKGTTFTVRLPLTR